MEGENLNLMFYILPELSYTADFLSKFVQKSPGMPLNCQHLFGVVLLCTSRLYQLANAVRRH